MSRDIQFADMVTGLDQFGSATTVITVSDVGTPHVTTSLVSIGDERLEIGVGSRARSNILQRPDITLVWYPADGGDYQMIIDGSATEVGRPDERGVSSVSIVVRRGILHRLAGAPGSGATCRAIGSNPSRNSTGDT